MKMVGEERERRTANRYYRITRRRKGKIPRLDLFFPSQSLNISLSLSHTLASLPAFLFLSLSHSLFFFSFSRDVLFPKHFPGSGTREADLSDDAPTLHDRS